MKMRTLAAVWGSIWIAGVVIGQTAEPVPNAADPYAEADPGLGAFIERMRTDDDYVGRFYDQRWSPKAMERRGALYDEFAAGLKKIEFGGLSLHAKVDYVLALHWIAAQKADLSLRQKRLMEMEAALPFREIVQGLEARRRAMEDVDPRASAVEIGKIPDMVKKVREAIECGRKAEKKDGEKGEAEGGEDTGGTPVPQDGEGKKGEDKKSDEGESGATASPEPAITLTPVVALRTAGAVDELRRVMGDWSGYYVGYKPEAGWWIKQPTEAADKALADYSKFLREEIAGVKGVPEDPLVGDPIGPEALREALAVEMIAYTPEQLIGIANDEFAWCEGEMKKAAAEMGFNDDWKAALAKVKQDSVPPGEQDVLVREQARAAIAFLKERDLVTVPALAEEMWRVEMLSPQAQRTLPFAVYGGQYMGVAYPTDAMTTDDKLMSMRGNNRHFTHNVTPHELIPGHHLQGFFEQRVRAYRSLFSTPFLVEGWALYWEMELYDRGWQASPEDRIGALFWRMHRCARIIVSLKFHLGEMTPEEMVQFLVDRVGHEKFGATSEVRRFIGGDYSPLYQCGYMVGGLQLRALGREVVGDEPPGELEAAGGTGPAAVPHGALTRKELNDAVLRCGPIPVELIRDEITGASPRADGGVDWKFAGERAGK
ncbi:MAG: DUF885 family protein [Phycisphaerales bacterium]|jgi:hypothetical protein